MSLLSITSHDICSGFSIDVPRLLFWTTVPKRIPRVYGPVKKKNKNVIAPSGPKHGRANRTEKRRPFSFSLRGTKTNTRVSHESTGPAPRQRITAGERDCRRSSIIYIYIIYACVMTSKRSANVIDQTAADRRAR